MSLEELEDICTRRGFELITDEFDEETGHPLVYTKDDYITAAWQCVTMGTLQVTDYDPYADNKAVTTTNDDDYNSCSNDNKKYPFVIGVLRKVFGEKVLIRFIKKVGQQLRAIIDMVRRESIASSDTTTTTTTTGKKSVETKPKYSLMGMPLE
eukprot:CAMPEP_0178916688 /NCGR_PEP_ID=MMETSP0786-20121207/12798_1 /TAXON_ID=186022 /ORGANISM="Thalassionema frauenfeldii, Strain CCMP 1798" /LENGTH=152 /DNA_ID=CAMNT_0020590091 /DNA_START=264 /DNA_END=722 /DNA_ORIENTATION=+